MTRILLLIAWAAFVNSSTLRAQRTQACLNVDLGTGEYLWGMAPDGSGGYVLVGTLYPDGPFSSAEIARVSGQGTLIQGLVSVHNDHAVVLKAVAHTPDGGFAVVGGSGTTGMYHLLIAKFNSEGELLWSRSVGEQIYSGSSGIAVAVAEDGNLLIAGSRGDVSGNFRPFMLKFDSEGTLLWKSLYEFVGTINGEATGIVALPDGGCIVTGYQYVDVVVVANAWIMRLDNAGQVVWSRTTPPGARFDALVPSNDGGYVLSGEVEPPFAMAGDYDACMVKIDANGQLIWDVIVGTDKIDFTPCIARTADDGFVAGGATYVEGIAPKAYLVKVNGNGELLWTRKIGSPVSNYECFAVHPTMNGGLALGIRSGDGAQKDMGLVLTDEFGMPCPACGVDSGGSASQGITFEDHAVTLLPIADTIPRDLVFLESGTSYVICDGVGIAETTIDDEDVTIAPQPMNTSVQVTLPEAWLRAGPMTFMLHDALGRQVLSMPVMVSPFKLDRQGMRAGAYHYQLLSGERPFAAGRLIME